MKKFFAMLMMATLVLSLAAVAGPTYTLKDGYQGEIPVLEPVQFNTNNTVYKPSNLKLNYTVTGSINRKYLELSTVKDENGKYVNYKNEAGKWATNWYRGTGQTDWDLAHVYFTANDNYRMALFVDVDSKPTSELRINSQLNITDYGIYLYENNDPSTNHITEYISLKNGDYAITEGTNFGVYYTADTEYTMKDDKYNPNNADLSDTTFAEKGVVRTNTYDKTYTTAENWIASYDGEKPGNHSVNANMNWYSDGKILKSDAAIFCMYQGPFNANDPAFLEWQHVEFGFVTTGQPLPGTLTTLLISGLCAAGLRKRNKK
ncbi:MAG: hypothetical protein IKZ46_07655 [Victivallales bacterium]|nr:hypothetical protein [Victivallales bacterium]